jgi:ubiquinone/menaquinone biosynthesis C-methylase UbiE
VSKVLESTVFEAAEGPGFFEKPSFVVSTSDDLKVHAHDRFIEIVSGHLQSRHQLRWLDVGCGWHFDWRWEEKREKDLLAKARVVGLDPDWRALARHRSIEKRAVGIVERLPFAEGIFDLVTANVVVEHLKHPALAFAEIFRVLQPGGVFVFRTPSARSHFVRVAKLLPQGIKTWLTAGILDGRSEEDVYPAHYLANTVEDVGALCQMIGFRNTHVLITRAQGALRRVPLFAKVERGTAAAFGMTEGNLIVEAQK